VHCSTLSAELLERELFGVVEQGVFVPGKIEAARGGTLFLDEIGEMPLDLQPRLLTLLEKKSYVPAGTTELRSASVRIVGACQHNLEQLCEEGKFRRDLFFRVCAVVFQVPPLRERLEDFSELVDLLLRRIAERSGSEVTQITPDAVTALTRYDWPGNLRELENVLENAALCCSNKTIYLSDIVLDHSRALRRKTSEAFLLGGQPLEEIERRAIVETLRLCKGNKAAASRKLGISERNVHYKIKKYRLQDHV
jgi:transcriptional regulator with PAS, ATPase and Fis domain